MMKHRRHAVPLLLLAASIAGLLPGCSGEDGGRFNLGSEIGAWTTQVLSLEVDTHVAALEISLPFDPSHVLASTISLALSKKPEDTHMEYAVKEDAGIVRLGVISGGEKGLEGKALELEVHYLRMGGDSGTGLFQEVNIETALDTGFATAKDAVRTTWKERAS